jgi:uncharacterized protein YecE (DUF72 family)
MSASQGKIRVGIGGWVFEPWRGTFYPDGLPQKRELEYTADRLGTIEINGTYYGSQKPESFARWRAETPGDFVFALKGSRYITNRRVLAEAAPSIEKFFTGGVMELKEKLGPINWQFMPTKRFDPADFEAFLKLLPQSVDGVAIRHAVEVRHDSFRSPDFIALLREYGVAVITSADSDYTQIADITAPFVYARIMGTKEAQQNGYSDADLDRWVERARIWATGKVPDGLQTVGAAPAEAGSRDVFLYVISGDKVRNPAAAIALTQRLAAKA